MSTSKRKGSRGPMNPTAVKSSSIPFTSAPQPVHSAQAGAARATTTADSLRAERAGLGQRQALALGATGGLLLAVALLVLPWQTARPAAPAAVAPTAQAIPVVAAPTLAPVPTVAAPIAVVVPAITAAPAMKAAPAPTVVVATTPAPATTASFDPSLCVAAGGLPVFTGAVCTRFDTDEDDGVIKHESTYATSATVEEVRRFYEAAFASNGWSVTEFDNDRDDGTWEFTVAQALREVRVKIEPEVMQGASVTEITLKER